MYGKGKIDVSITVNLAALLSEPWREIINLILVNTPTAGRSWYSAKISCRNLSLKCCYVWYR